MIVAYDGAVGMPWISIGFLTSFSIQNLYEVWIQNVKFMRVDVDNRTVIFVHFVGLPNILALKNNVKAKFILIIRGELIICNLNTPGERP